MNMKIFIHADDFGLTSQDTRNILEAVSGGILKSVSLVPNGEDFDNAVRQLKNFPHIRVAVHLNLTQGKPVSPPAEIKWLVDEKGEFLPDHILFIWWAWLCFTRKRPLLKEQIKQELTAQITRVCAALGNNAPVYVDSHRHLHMLPVFFDSLLELHKEFNFGYIRLPVEKFLLVDKKDLFQPKFWLSFLKHDFLNTMAFFLGYRDRLRRRNIPTCDHFLGVLYTARMSEAVVRECFKAPKEGMAEVLFHPGANPVELQELKKSSFKEFIASLNTGDV